MMYINFVNDYWIIKTYYFRVLFILNSRQVRKKYHIRFK